MWFHSTTGLEKSGRLVAICDQKIFLATRSQAAVVNLATNFSTKGPVWRPQFCALFHVRRNGTARRPENERQVSENEIQNFENLSRYSRNVNLTHTHTPARPIPPPPSFEYGSSFFLFFGSFLNTSIIHKTAQLRPLSCQSVLFLAKTRSRTRFSSCDHRTNSAVVEQRDRRNGESVHFQFRA